MSSKHKKPDKYVCTLSPELLHKAKTELNEDPERREQDIQELRARLEKYPDLNARTDAAFLIRYLRARKFNIDRAFETILNFYRFKKENPEIFDNLPPSGISQVLDDGFVEVLPDRDENGCAIVLYRMGRWDTEKISAIDSIRAYFIILTKLIEDEETQVNGVVFLQDLKDATLRHMSHWTPGVLKKSFGLFQDCFPMRIKAVHYVNELSLIKYLFPLIKVFMKQKLLDRLHFHSSDYPSFHKFIKPEILPEEYGGLKSTMSTKEWGEILDDCEREFKEQQKYGFKDALAEYNPKQDAMDMLAGSFKKLES